MSSPAGTHFVFSWVACGGDKDWARRVKRVILDTSFILGRCFVVVRPAERLGHWILATVRMTGAASRPSIIDKPC
jgi:hypothetical protein